MTALPKVAIIGTGGTISSIGRDEMDVVDYVTLGKMHDAAGMIAAFPSASRFGDLIPVAFPPIPSTQMDYAAWAELNRLIEETCAAHVDLAGIVILHGTASLEETAYALSLTTASPVPVVVTGAQRPSTGLSTDAAANMTNAVRVAIAPEVQGLGVLVVLNDEIHAARDVTKTSTFRLQTFQAPDFGCLGHVDYDGIALYRRLVRATAPDTPFTPAMLRAAPRVDITYSYAGSDGAAVAAFIEAGAQGIVSAGFAPGYISPAEFTALKAAVDAGIVVVQSSRAGSGRVPEMAKVKAGGFIGADTLNPQKARILLSLALATTHDTDAIRDIFARY
ncbi:MAG: asparaginase [Pseudomonadota bacterium]